MGKLPEATRAKIVSLLAGRGVAVDALTEDPTPPPPDFASYLRATLPRGWTADARHLRLIAEHLDAVERGEIDRLAIHMPPRHAKTETVTIRGAGWMFERRPESNVLVTGYNQRIANRFSRKTRNLIGTRIALAPDQKAADEWGTTQGGTFMARGVGSPPTGVGFRRIFIDDPIRRRQDAESEVYREAAWDWYTDDLYTRLEPGGAIVLVCTRWHEDDIAARAVASEPGRWTVLNLPAISDDGQALWPERFDVEALHRIRSVMIQNEGERSWEALYQQRPTAREGSFFKPDRIAIDTPPRMVRQTRGWDLAATSGGGDYTVGVLMGVDEQGRYWILDCVRGQWGPDERDRVLLQTAQLDGRAVRVRLPQDPGQAGKQQALHLTRLLSAFRLKIESVSGDKEIRAEPLASQVNGGNVLMAEGAWNKALIGELRSFPVGVHDDIVDAAADAFNDLAQSRVRFVPV